MWYALAIFIRGSHNVPRLCGEKEAKEELLLAARLPSENKALKLAFRYPSAFRIASVGSKSFNCVV